MSALYESCGGCGAETPSERCIGCPHDFGSGQTAPSNANTSGLSEAWVRLSKTFSDRFYEGYEPEIEAMSAAVVTAASAQARIAELEAENESHRSGGWILAEMKRRQEAEARADRLAKALERIAYPEYGLGFNKLRGIARAALQQETQP